MWILGIDAGGTKTHCAIAKLDGTIIAEGFGGPSNYQIVGEESAQKELKTSIDQALERAGILCVDLACAVFGMSGADEEIDFDVLNPLVKRLMGDVPSKVVHDSWIGMRSEVEDMTGIVSICGTGAGHSGRNSKGEQVTLRNLHYELGNMGGGEELVSQALHYAFRSNEGTYTKTVLEEVVLEVFDLPDMETLCQKIRDNGMSAKENYLIPIRVFEAANHGDEVAIMLLERMGYEEGLYGVGVIKRLHMEEEAFPIVLIGSLFQTGNKYLINAYMKAIKEVAPKAFPLISTKPPVIGAIGMGMDWIGTSFFLT